MSAEDRRAHHRFPTAAPVRVAVADRATFANEYLIDISRGGCFVRSDAEVVEGQPVTVRFEIGERVSVVLDGEVMRVREADPRGFGVRFLDVSLERLAHLDDFIAGTVGELGERGARHATREIPRDVVDQLLREVDDAALARTGTPVDPTPLEIDVEEIEEFTAVEPGSVDWLDSVPTAALTAAPVMGGSAAPAAPPAPAKAAAPAPGGPRRATTGGRSGDPLGEVSELLGAMVGRLSGETAYAVLGAEPHEWTADVRRRAEGELARLDAAREALPGGNDGLADQLSAVRDAMAGALDHIVNPTARAALDVSLGHFTPRARLPQEQIALAAAAEALRAPYVRRNMVLVNRAALYAKAAEREATGGDRDRAIESARHAVELDPYNIELRDLLQALEAGTALPAR